MSLQRLGGSCSLAMVLHPIPSVTGNIISVLWASVPYILESWVLPSSSTKVALTSPSITLEQESPLLDFCPFSLVCRTLLVPQPNVPKMKFFPCPASVVLVTISYAVRCEALPLLHLRNQHLCERNFIHLHPHLCMASGALLGSLHLT